MGIGSGSSGHLGNDYQIVAALNAEWLALVDRHRGNVRHWAGKHPLFAASSDLDDVLTVIHTHPDSAMRILLAENHQGDELAGRVVLQTMLGKLVSMAHRDQRSGVDDYVAQMWCLIRTYPLDSRPRKIAANLALDTLKAVTREDPVRRERVNLALMPTGSMMDQAATIELTRQSLDHNAEIASLTAGRVIFAAVRLGLIDLRTRDVLTTVYAEGLSGRQAAVRHKMSPEMVRFRCSKAVRRLANHASELAETA